MDIGPGETGKIDLHFGANNVVQINKPVRWVIETMEGTIIKCISTPNNPFEITPFADIKRIDMIIDDDSTTPVGLLGKP